MIVISVSLVLIGLLVWAIGDNYHFSSDIMANQEIDAMTPKHGFNLVYYDTAQPVGAKLKLLDAASIIDDAQQKQMQYAKQNPSPNGMVLIFNETLAANQQLVRDTVATITKLKADQAQAQAQAQAAKAQAASQTAAAPANQTTSTTQTGKNITPVNATKIMTTNATKIMTTNATKVMTTNATKIMTTNATKVMTTNATKVMTTNATKIMTTNATKVMTTNATLSGKPTGANSENLAIGANVTITHSSNATTSNHTKTKSLSDSVRITTP